MCKVKKSLSVKFHKVASQRYVYTSNTIKISKVLKGDLTCGTIELITDGGIVDGLWVDRSHSLKLGKRNKGIFLATATGKEISSVDFYAENNNQKLEATFQNQSFIKYWHDGLDWRVSDVWANYDSIAQVYALAEGITGLNFIDCDVPTIFGPGPASDTTQVEEQEIVMPTYNPANFEELRSYVEYQKMHYTNQDRDNSGEKIFYELENFIITGSATKFLEFDVMVWDNLGTGYLDLSAVRIEYDTNVFGSNIVNNTNIEVTRGTLNSDTNCYSDPLPFDLAPDAFTAWALETTYSQCKTPILTTPQKLMRLKMRIQDCSILSDIELLDAIGDISPSLILETSAYSDFPADTFSTFYAELQHQQTEPVPACVPTITSFTPTTVAGGIGQVLEIHGFQFGSVRGSGTVFFKNANDGGTTEVNCDEGDFVSWTDSHIQLRVPSNDRYASDPISTPSSPAGTGVFRVVTDLADEAISPSPVAILYSVRNSDFGITQRLPFFLAPTNNQNDKFIFYLDSLVATFQNGAMVPIIRKALKEWTCLTGINWELVSDTNVSLPGPLKDSICVIKFGSLAPGRLALATVQGGFCNDKYYTTESDIEISNDPNTIWFLDTVPSNPIPSGQNDLYFAMLHELGHAHNMNHIINPDSIMHFDDNTGGTFRKIELYLDEPAFEGGNWVMDGSFNYPPNDSCAFSAVGSVSSPLCGMIFGISETDGQQVTFYPNPFAEAFSIHSDSQPIRNVIITDLSGKLIHRKEYQSVFKVSLNLANTDNGIYLIKITFENGLEQINKMVKIDH